MQITKTFYARSRAEWRAWLKKNHKAEMEIWLVLYKKGTGRPTLPIEDAIEEALCFGWVDSMSQRIDDEKYGLRFTPRKKTSKWSALNKQRVAKLIRQGLMTAAGRATLTYSNVDDDYGRTPQRKAADLVIPNDFKQALSRNPKAWVNFNNLAASYRRNYIRWIAAARTDATRDKRLAEAVQLLAANKKLGLK